MSFSLAELPTGTLLDGLLNVIDVTLDDLVSSTLMDATINDALELGNSLPHNNGY